MGRGIRCRNRIVTFELPDKGPSGFFPGLAKIQKQPTNSQGRAGTYGYTPNDQPGAVRIRVTAERGSDRGEANIEQLNTQGNYDAGISPSKRRGWAWLAVIGAGAGAGIAVGWRNEAVVQRFLAMSGNLAQ